MWKKCSRCGSEMRIELRNVVYRSSVRILNVPVHVCSDDSCGHSQVVEEVKDDLKRLMNELGRNPARQHIDFEEISEFSNMLMTVACQCEEQGQPSSVEQRVNDLLDMFLLAQSVGDKKWMDEIRSRLVELVH